MSSSFNSLKSKYFIAFPIMSYLLFSCNRFNEKQAYSELWDIDLNCEYVREYSFSDSTIYLSVEDRKVNDLEYYDGVLAINISDGKELWFLKDVAEPIHINDTAMLIQKHCAWSLLNRSTGFEYWSLPTMNENPWFSYAIEMGSKIVLYAQYYEISKDRDTAITNNILMLIDVRSGKVLKEKSPVDDEFIVDLKPLELHSDSINEVYFLQNDKNDLAIEVSMIKGFSKRVEPQNWRSKNSLLFSKDSIGTIWVYHRQHQQQDILKYKYSYPDSCNFVKSLDFPRNIVMSYSIFKYGYNSSSHSRLRYIRFEK